MAAPNRYRLPGPRLVHLEEYRDKNILDGDREFYRNSAICAVLCAVLLVGLYVALGWVA